MCIPSLFDLSLFELANDPRFDLCSAYEQFLALFDDGKRTPVADKFLDKFLALQVQRRSVWRGTHVIRRFALSRHPSVTYYGTYVRRATACGRRAVRGTNARFPPGFYAQMRLRGPYGTYPRMGVHG